MNLDLHAPHLILSQGPNWGTQPSLETGMQRDVKKSRASLQCSPHSSRHVLEGNHEKPYCDAWLGELPFLGQIPLPPSLPPWLFINKSFLRHICASISFSKGMELIEWIYNIFIHVYKICILKVRIYTHIYVYVHVLKGELLVCLSQYGEAVPQWLSQRRGGESGMRLSSPLPPPGVEGLGDSWRAADLHSALEFWASHFYYQCRNAVTGGWVDLPVRARARRWKAVSFFHVLLSGLPPECAA